MSKYEMLLLLEDIGLIQVEDEIPDDCPFASHYEYHYIEDSLKNGIFVRNLR